MHIKSETRRLLKRRSTKAVVVLLTAVLAIQSVNLPAIAMAASSGDDGEAVITDSPASDAATEEATTGNDSIPNTEGEGAEPAATDNVQQGVEPAPVDSDMNAASDAAAAPATNNQVASAAPAEDTTATVSLNLNDSSLTYSEQVYQSDATSLEAPVQQELKFTVAPVDGYQIDTVKQVVNGVETELTADENGIYTIAADAVADGLAINVATSEVPPAEEAPAEEPATEGDENTAADEGATENGDESVTDDAADAEEVTEGDESANEATPGDEVASKVAGLMSTLSNGVSTFATNNLNLTVGETVDVECTDSSRWHTHSWTSSNTGVATVTTDEEGFWWNREQKSTSTQTITAKGEGTATIKCGNAVIATVSVSAPTGAATISFNANGGQGAPSPMETEIGEIVTLPDGSGMSRDGYVLLGWSTSSDANSVDEGYDAVVLPLGSKYEVESRSTTLYAVWGKTSSWEMLLSVAVRDDGAIPGEPSLQYAKYTYLVDKKWTDVTKYVNPAHTVAGVDAVKAVLTEDFYN